MLSNKLNVLITRPENEGRVLADKLNGIGIHTYCQPMFDYQPSNTHENLSQLYTQVNQPIVIFISVASVTYANQLNAISTWPVSKIIAVGNATLQALTALGIDAVAPQLQTSEGLLFLPELQHVEGQDIIIVRGDGGRELLAESLQSRKAIVYYFETYQRIWRQLTSKVAQHWRSNNINCIVITSDALLQSVVQLINLSDSYWLNTCYWVVASERIAQNAKTLGLKNVVNANGANDKAIAEALTSNVIMNME